MTRLFASALLALSPIAQAGDSLPARSAIDQKRIHIEASGNGRDSIHLQATATEKIKVTVPAGTRFVENGGQAQIALRSLDLEPGPGSDVEAILPAAALSSANLFEQRTLTLASDTEPKLAKLLELFGQQNDLPRPTAQLAVFLVLEDITWDQWKQWMQQAWALEKPPKEHPNQTDIAQAVDAIAFAKLSAPERSFAILANADFKRQALRNTFARGKAMALYGMTVDDAVTGNTAAPPDLGKLLHTAPNDNCPICRMRAKAAVDVP